MRSRRPRGSFDPHAVAGRREGEEQATEAKTQEERQERREGRRLACRACTTYPPARGGIQCPTLALGTWFWLASRLVGWFVGWLVSWLLGCLVVWVSHCCCCCKHVVGVVIAAAVVVVGLPQH